jgi:eukaryotic-like serine/threonine-protein kinase
MGAVYEVEHARTGERLALKVLLSGLGASAEALERFKREARASARIRSEHVVRVTDADVAPELGGVPFLVMELLEGQDLERLAASATTAAAPAIVVEWLRQVARALDKAHQLGIVHRDLKPENLFLAQSDDGSTIVKILDFGIVKMTEEGTAASGSGQILGTLKYMAPEQAAPNAPVTPAADRCALGLVAYRLLVGESYYQGGAMIILGQLLHGELQAPSDRGCQLGAEFDAWFLRACHRDPLQRFSSASKQIEALAAALGVPVLTNGAPLAAAAQSSPPPSRRSKAFGVLALLGLVATLLAGWIMTRQRTSDGATATATISAPFSTAAPATPPPQPAPAPPSTVLQPLSTATALTNTGSPPAISATVPAKPRPTPQPRATVDPTASSTVQTKQSTKPPDPYDGQK